MTTAAIDAWTIARRDLLHWVRQPAQLIFGLLSLLVLVLMFAYLIGGAMTVPGGGDYREFLMPGMFAMTVFFGIEATMLAVSTDVAKGVTDRFRSLPISGAAVVVGRCVADLMNSALGLAVIVACGLVIGWQARAGLWAALAAFGLLLLLRVALLWVGIYLGLIFREPGAIQAVQFLVWPLAFLSNIFAAPESMPGVLGAIVEWNPLSATVSATRLLFGNPGVGGESFAAQNSMLLAVLWPIVLTAIFFPLSVRSYRRLSR